LYLIYIVNCYTEFNTYTAQHGITSLKTDEFWIRKFIGISIQVFFLIYEFIQAFEEGHDYLLDPFNYIELLDPILYFVASYLDIINDEKLKYVHSTFHDMRQIIRVLTIMSMLGKLLNLIKCFHHLSQLVMMIEQVVIDSFFFFLLFFVFLLTFAECYNILKVDTSPYARFPSILGELISTARSSMGDNALIDPYEGFDLYDIKDGKVHYLHSLEIVYFTYIVWGVAVFFLFMIFMNFIIAVITESYNKIHAKRVSYRYLQKIKMVHEKEAHFREKDFLDIFNFP
jgi:hypothetical protein